MSAVMRAFDMGDVTADEAKAAIVASIRREPPNAKLTGIARNGVPNDH